MAALAPPGPAPDEAYDTAMAFAADPLGMFEKLVDRYGRIFQLQLGPTPTVFLHDANVVEKVLRLDFEDYGQSSDSEEKLAPLLGRSMPVVSDHLYWEQLHAIILPMFTPVMLKRYFEQTLHAVAEEVHHLEDAHARGEPIKLLQFVREGVFSALTQTIFTRGIDAKDIPTLLGWFTSTDAYMSLRYLAGPAADEDPTPEIAAGRESLQRINDYVYDLITRRRADLRETPEDMLDVLLMSKTPEGKTLTDKEVRDNVVALFFGGQETTPSVITWAFGLLSANPDKREKMLAEIDSVLGGRAPTFQDLAKLEYTEGVLDEALRLYPPFTFVGRETLNDVELGGFEIKKGTALGFVGWTIHRDPAHWPDPLAFEPERHTREMKNSRAKCAFLAFGYGRRRCTGERVGRMESLLMLALVSQKFLLNRVGGGQSPTHVAMAIKPADGLPMEIAAR